MPDERYFSMPSADVGAEVRRKRALNCWPWVRSLTHWPEAMIHFARGSRMADHRHDDTVSPRPRAQDAETILSVVVGYSLDETCQHFPGARLRTHAKRGKGRSGTS